MAKGALEELELAGHRVRALSIGGLETCIDLPGFKVAFDAGRCPPELVARDHVLLTHAHMDHMAGVTYHTSTRVLRRMRPPTYVLPPHYVEDFERLFEAWRRLDRSTMDHETVPLGPGEAYVLSKGVAIRAFAAVHTQVAQGYAVMSRREKLLSGFRGLSGERLRRLREEEGVTITETREVCEVAFCGDTRIEVVEREPLVRTARLLILETTFVDDRVPVAEARAKGHVHLDEIAERAELFENEAILLTHFSARYGAREILRALDEKLPPDLRRRVTPLLGAHS